MTGAENYQLSWHDNHNRRLNPGGSSTVTQYCPTYMEMADNMGEQATHGL